MFCCSSRRSIRENPDFHYKKKIIKPGSIIISDCWKGYINLQKYGYTHNTVNYSVEFVIEHGNHTNKIEGHWKQLKCSLPTHEKRKYHYPSYFAECGAMLIVVKICMYYFSNALKQFITIQLKLIKNHIKPMHVGNM